MFSMWLMNFSDTKSNIAWMHWGFLDLWVNDAKERLRFMFFFYSSVTWGCILELSFFLVIWKVDKCGVMVCYNIIGGHFTTFII